MVRGPRAWVGVGLSTLAVVLSCFSGAACADKKGGLMLAISTDMKAPKDVSIVSITVSTNSQIKHNFIGRVTPDGKVDLPATLAIVEPEDKNASIRVRVIAFQEKRPRVLRDVRTSIPSGRTALLRIPLNFVDDGSAASGQLGDDVMAKLGGAPRTVGSTSDGGAEAGSSDAGAEASASVGGPPPSDANGAEGTGFDPYLLVSKCTDPDQTQIDGTCRDSFVDPGNLPEYEEKLVFGENGESSCFDLKRAFARAVQVGGGVATQPPGAFSLDRGTCTVQGVGADQLESVNVALVTSDTGECLKPGECYVPIDKGEGGWSVQGGAIKLPSFACTLLDKNRIFVSLGSAPKTASQPICRPQAKKNTLACLDSCGACVTQHCASDDIAACFGPEWAQGNVSGVCKEFYDCTCKCGSTRCSQCDPQQGSTPSPCQACLNTHLDACVQQNCRQACDGGDRSDGGSETPTASVALSFTPLDPPPQPSPGPGFTSTQGQFFSPVPGDDAVSANDSNGTFFKVEYCRGTLAVGKTFSQLSRGPGCTNGNPVVNLGMPSQAGWTASQGTVRVVSLSPLTFAFEGLRMDPIDNGKATGSFSLSGQGAWLTASATAP